MSFTNEVKELSRKDKSRLLEKGYLFTSDSSILLDGWFALVINAYLRELHGPDVRVHDIIGVIGSDNAGTITLPKLVNTSNWIRPTSVPSSFDKMTSRGNDRATFFHFKFKTAEDCMNYRLSFM